MARLVDSQGRIVAEGNIVVQSDGVFLVNGSHWICGPYEVDGQTITSKTVDKERDRRADGGVVFAGKRYQTRPQDRENINGAGTLALAALVQGIGPGNYNWHGKPTPFEWIAEDNSTVQMDAPTVLAFGAAVASLKSDMIHCARKLKDLDPVPADFETNDEYWSPEYWVDPEPEEPE